MNSLHELPEELLNKILLGMDLESLLNTRAVCKRLKESTCDGHIWKSYAKQFGLIDDKETDIAKSILIRRIDLLKNAFPSLFQGEAKSLSVFEQYKYFKSEENTIMFRDVFKKPLEINDIIGVQALIPFVDVNDCAISLKYPLRSSIFIGSLKYAEVIKEKKIQCESFIDLPLPRDYSEAIKMSRVISYFIKEGVVKDLSKFIYTERWIIYFVDCYKIENNPDIDEMLTLLKPSRNIDLCQRYCDDNKIMEKHNYFSIKSDSYFYYIDSVIRKSLHDIKRVLSHGFQASEISNCIPWLIDLILEDKEFVSDFIANYKQKHVYNLNEAINDLISVFINGESFYLKCNKLKYEEILSVYQMKNEQIDAKKIENAFFEGDFTLAAKRFQSRAEDTDGGRHYSVGGRASGRCRPAGSGLAQIRGEHRKPPVSAAG